MMPNPCERLTDMTNRSRKDSALMRRFGPVALLTGASDAVLAAPLPHNWLNMALI